MTHFATNWHLIIEICNGDYNSVYKWIEKNYDNIKKWAIHKGCKNNNLHCHAALVNNNTPKDKNAWKCLTMSFLNFFKRKNCLAGEMFEIDNTTKECMGCNLYFNRVHIKNAYHWSNVLSFIERKKAKALGKALIKLSINFWILKKFHMIKKNSLRLVVTPK